MIYVGIVGYGTIGSGVYEVLGTNKDYIAKRAGEEVAVKYICDLRDFPGDPAEKLITHDFNDIVNDPEVKVVVESMGGLHPAYEFVKKALESGKSVCSSNKELVAEYGAELLALAKTYLHFHAAPLEIKRYRDKSKSVGLYKAVQTHYFPLMHEEPSLTEGILVEYVSLFVRRYVHLFDIRFAVFYGYP